MLKKMINIVAGFIDSQNVHKGLSYVFGRG
jgi:hypothetical protein